MNLGRVQQRCADALRHCQSLDADKGRVIVGSHRVLGRGVAETRAGLGGTYAALSAWALLSRRPAAHTAVGVMWLGAAAARIGALLVDDPQPNGTYWAYLAAELGFGSLAIVSAMRAV